MLKPRHNPTSTSVIGKAISHEPLSIGRPHAYAKEPAISSSPLSISAPLASASPNQTTPSNIILVIKYDFVAENKSELSVSKGNLVKLLDTPGDGWLLVKYIDRVASPGLVPALYVDIAVNDTRNPVTLTWLHGYSSPSDQKSSDIWDDSLFLKLHLKDTSQLPLTINGRAYPLSVSISTFLLYNERYSYRLDVTYSNNSFAHLCRYYEDFFSMHAELRAEVANCHTESAPPLPKLPEPSSSAGTAEDDDASSEALVRILLQRCKDLNVYINSLVLIPHFRLSKPLLDWFETSYKNLPAISFSQGEERLDAAAVNKTLLPGSVDILSEFYASQKDKKVKETVTDPLHDLGVFRTTSKNTYNLYHHAAVAREGLIMRSQSQRTKPILSPRSADNFDLQSHSAPQHTPSDHVPHPSKYALPQPRDPNPLLRSHMIPGLPPVAPLSVKVRSTVPRAHENYVPFARSNVHVDPAHLPVKSLDPSQSQSDFYKPSYSLTSTSAEPHTKQHHAYPNIPQTQQPPPRIRARSDGFPAPGGYRPINIPRFHSTGSRRPPNGNSRSSAPTPAISTGPYIKLKVIVSDVEIVALKASKLLIRNLDDLKSIIRQRIPFSHLHIKLPGTNSFHDVDVISFNVVECMQSNDKLLFETH